MEDLIKQFISVSKKFAFGSGDNKGYGNGSGYGNDYGYGDGSGSGCGYGDGSGYGCGNGYDYVLGSGYGYDNGSGYSKNRSDGIKKYGKYTIYMIDGIQTIIKQIHQNYATGAILQSDLSLRPCYIAKVGNYFAHATTLKEAVREANDKHLQSLSKEERIDEFISEYPDPDKLHSGVEFFRWHNILTGSCEMGRKQFCIDHDIDINADYTPMQFLNLCKDAYGGEIIQQVIKAYGASDI